MTDSPLTLGEYLAQAKTTLVPSLLRLSAQQLTDYFYFGMIGEIGEVAQLLKRELRDGAQFTGADVAKELGDVLWYAVMLYDGRARNHPRKTEYLAHEIGLFVPPAPIGEKWVHDLDGRLHAQINMLVHLADVLAASGFNAESTLTHILVILGQIAHNSGTSLTDAATTNLQKLADRQQRGMIKGGGDDR
jgi:hypothetical protein